MKTPSWWFCPSDPPCPHPGLVHDIYLPEDPRPMCCMEGCTCGRPATPAVGGPPSQD
jgi:hypothetical protein